MGYKDIRLPIAIFRGNKWLSLEDVIALLDKLNYCGYTREEVEELITELEKE